MAFQTSKKNVLPKMNNGQRHRQLLTCLQLETITTRVSTVAEQAKSLPAM